MPATASAITAGGDHTCALLTNGSVWCWGSNTDGELGNGTTGGASNVPVKVSNLGMPNDIRCWRQA